MTASLRVLILTPTAMPSITGNALTVERWRRSLTAQGVSVSVLSGTAGDRSAFIKELHRFEPNLIHVHHAFRTTEPLLHEKTEAVIGHMPLILSPGGTDLNVDWLTERGRRIITRMFKKSRYIITQSENMSDIIGTIMPHIQDRIALVPKSFMWMGHDPFDLRKAANCSPDDILFFMPAGLRPVKGNLDFLLKMKPVLAARPQARVIFAGNPMDTAYAEIFKQKVRRFAPRVAWVSASSPLAMRSCYDAAQVVVNASASEGLSNSLIEAMAAGRPVLASDIPGNRYPLCGNNGDRPAGLLYAVGDEKDFYDKVLHLIDDAGRRERLAHAGTIRAKQMPTPEQEAAHLIRIYRNAVEG